ncbi:MAG: AzlD domain-containing protein, partial [Spirochaetota bacterium]
TNVIAVIAGMTAVTYLPRLIPLLVHGRRALRPWERRAMRLVPLTAIGALIVPGGLVAVDGRADLSAVGLVAAVGLAVLVRQPFVVVVGSVGAVVLAIALGM